MNGLFASTHSVCSRPGFININKLNLYVAIKCSGDENIAKQKTEQHTYIWEVVVFFCDAMVS